MYGYTGPIWLQLQAQWIHAPIPIVTHMYILSVEVMGEGNRVNGLVSEASSLPSQPHAARNESKTSGVGRHSSVGGHLFTGTDPRVHTRCVILDLGLLVCTGYYAICCMHQQKQNKIQCGTVLQSSLSNNIYAIITQWFLHHFTLRCLGVYYWAT